MSKLDVFCSRTGLDYDGVVALISRLWIRSGINLFIRHLDNSCDLAAKQIVGLTDAVLDRMHRELRLALRTGLSAREIDRLAAAGKLGAFDLGVAALRALPELQRLADVLSGDLGRLITWLDRIPTDGTPSEHALLFQNPAATGPLDQDLTPAKISANEAADTAVPGSGRRLSAVAKDIAVALGVSETDLQRLLDHLSVAGLLGPNPALTAAGLSALHGRIGLARALKLTISDYLGLERLVGVDPLANVIQLATTVDAAGRLADAGVPVPHWASRPTSRPEPPRAVRRIGKVGCCAEAPAPNTRPPSTLPNNPLEPVRSVAWPRCAQRQKTIAGTPSSGCALHEERRRRVPAQHPKSTRTRLRSQATCHEITLDSPTRWARPLLELVRRNARTCSGQCPASPRSRS